MSRDDVKENDEKPVTSISTSSSMATLSPSSYDNGGTRQGSSNTQRVEWTKQRVVNERLAMDLEHHSKVMGWQLRVDKAVIVGDTGKKKEKNNMLVRFCVHCSDESVLYKTTGFMDTYVKDKQGQLSRVGSKQDKKGEGAAVVMFKSVQYDVYIEMLLFIDEQEGIVMGSALTLINHFKKNPNMNESEGSDAVKAVVDAIFYDMDETEDQVNQTSFVVALYRVDAPLKQDKMRALFAACDVDNTGCTDSTQVITLMMIYYDMIGGQTKYTADESNDESVEAGTKQRGATRLTNQLNALYDS